mmetsp:Transcript_34461/g.39869  ORF Transcript_34461/g.39869 Transcript_34461/m.39869 type:complete len:174 (+) Transcript_34461:73-594(+)
MKESHTDEELMTGIDILLKLIKNILKSPKEEKFRKIKKTNKAISTKLLNLICMDDLLMVINFEHESEEFYCFNISKFTSLAKAKLVIQDFYDEIRKKYMTPEELSKFELLKEQKRQMIEEHKKMNRMKEELEMKSKLDRVEKSTEEVKASKGNDLRFGANVVKFQPPAPARGR